MKHKIQSVLFYTLAVILGLYLSLEFRSCIKESDAKEAQERQVCEQKCSPHLSMGNWKGKCYCDTQIIVRQI